MFTYIGGNSLEGGRYFIVTTDKNRIFTMRNKKYVQNRRT